MNDRHKVFVSYHHANDQKYKNLFKKRFSGTYDIMVSKSVQIDDSEPNLKVETVRQKIRDEYIGDSTVTVVLIGAETWKRKHVDWEIGASIRDTKSNPRSGLIGIFLPTHPDYGRDGSDPYIMPPRLHFNVECKFAELYDWSDSPNKVQSWIHDAFKRRDKINPHNTYPLFAKNRCGKRWSK